MNRCGTEPSFGGRVECVCPLCRQGTLALYHEASHAVPWKLYDPRCVTRTVLRFFRCGSCDLVIKDPEVRPTEDQERAHYRKHNNNTTDAGYRQHLMRLVTPVLRSVPATAKGLDYGCGPQLSIEVLAREAGFECASYDPFFFPVSEVLVERGYDFVTCSEVVEHFRDPRSDFLRLRSILKPGGILGVMTHTVPDSFADWWYHRDPTHVSFYSARVFAWISESMNMEIVESEDGIVLFRAIT